VWVWVLVVCLCALCVFVCYKFIDNTNSYRLMFLSNGLYLIITVLSCHIIKVGLLRDRRGRRFFSVVKLILYQMQEFLMPLFAFVFMIAVGCVLLGTDSHSLVYYGYNWLCLILTNDTFERLFPDIVTSTDIASALLIFLLMYFGQGFIVNVLLGATLETFRSVSTKQIQKENLKRNQGLVKAFSVMDTHKTGRIQRAQFSSFLEQWKLELKSAQLNLYYELASEGDSEGISVFQFLKLPEIMCYTFEEETIVTKQIDASNIYIQEVMQATTSLLLQSSSAPTVNDSAEDIAQF
jgi:hypothetical protein